MISKARRILAADSPQDRKDLFEERLLLVQILTHCADLHTPTLEPAVARRVAESLSLENEKQAELEKGAGLKVTVMLAANTQSKAAMEVSFIQFVVRPLWNTLGSLFPELKVFLLRVVRPIVRVEPSCPISSCASVSELQRLCPCLVTAVAMMQAVRGLKACVVQSIDSTIYRTVVICFADLASTPYLGIAGQSARHVGSASAGRAAEADCFGAGGRRPALEPAGANTGEAAQVRGEDGLPSIRTRPVPRTHSHGRSRVRGQAVIDAALKRRQRRGAASRGVPDESNR